MYKQANQLSKSNRFYYIFSILCCWMLVLPAQQAHADKVENLYEASVPVKTQDREERTEAIRTAFIEVLVRVSGRADIADTQAHPGLATSIDTATRYAQQFRFYRADPAPTDPKAPQLVLWVRFDEQAVNRTLRNNQLPVWGDTRPATLVWLAIDSRGKRTLIGNDTRHQSRAVISKQARLRGVPLRFPLLDLVDQQNVNVSDVWGNFESRILPASQRYQVEAVLVGRVHQGASGAWIARWSLYSEARRQDWSVTESNLAQALTPGIDKTAESLAIRYAQSGHSDNNDVLVLVNGIKGLPEFNRTMEYLKTLSNVSDVHPFQVEQDKAVFRVTAAGGRLTLARSVSLGDVLIEEKVNSMPLTAPVVPLNNDSNATTDKFTQLLPDLTYRLAP